MKLDNIIYDVDTLGTAIQSDLINESATFNAMYPSQTSTELINTLSGYSTMLQYNMVSALMNCYTDTAYSPAGIYQLAETLGNRLHGNISSQLTCTLKRAELVEPAIITIPAGSVFNVEGLDFFNKEDIVFSSNQIDTIEDVTLIQGRKNVTEKISSGIPGERFYFAEDFSCNTNMVTATVNKDEWNILESFLPLNINNLLDYSQAQAFVLRTDPDGKTYLKAGSGANAYVPPAGANIKITWASNIGALGNINKSNLDIKLVTPIYYFIKTGEKIQLEVEAINSTPAIGGFDTQSLEVLKESSPYIFASGDRAVRRNDYKALLLNKCGYKTCNVWGEYEQANIEGTYNKIMMNMVYYSGIKSFQQYDLQKITSIDLDPTSLLFYEIPISQNSNTISTTMQKWYYEVSGYYSKNRGFLGSYEVELTGYNDANNPISLIYSDKYGYGILNLDYEDNAKKGLISKEDYETYYLKDDLGPDMYPNVYRSRIYDYSLNSGSSFTSCSIHNMDSDGGQTIRDLFNGGVKSGNYAANSNCYLFSGKKGGTKTLLTPQNPIQILIKFGDNKKRIRNLKVDQSEIPSGSSVNPNNCGKFVQAGVISSIIFKTPNDNEKLNKFIGTFAVYGSNEKPELENPSDDNSIVVNVKNNGNWVKLTDTITITQDLNPGDWTNWFSLNTFDAETGIWKDYEYYLIEVYSFRDQNSTEPQAGDRLAIGEIRALYGDQIAKIYTLDAGNADVFVNSVTLPGRASTIYYNNENYTILRIPNNEIYSNDGTGTGNYGTNDLLIPDTFNFYSYEAIVTGMTYENGFVAGNELTYEDSISGYTFKAKCINNITGDCLVTILKPSSSGTIETRVLKGKNYIAVEDIYFDNDTHETSKKAKLTIISTSCTDLYASFTGNYYTDLDVQKFDLPIIEKYNHFTTYLEFKQPKIKNISIDISVEYENVSTLNDVRNNIINAINDMLKITPYSLGKTFRVSDLWRTVSLVNGVKSLVVNSPTLDISALPYELIVLPLTNLTIRNIYNSYEELRIKEED